MSIKWTLRGPQARDKGLMTYRKRGVSLGKRGKATEKRQMECFGGASATLSTVNPLRCLSNPNANQLILHGHG